MGTRGQPEASLRTPSAKDATQHPFAIVEFGRSAVVDPDGVPSVGGVFFSKNAYKVSVILLPSAPYPHLVGLDAP